MPQEPSPWAPQQEQVEAWQTLAEWVEVWGTVAQKARGEGFKRAASLARRDISAMAAPLTQTASAREDF